jgi:hypothetical protein
MAGLLVDTPLVYATASPAAQCTHSNPKAAPLTPDGFRLQRRHFNRNETPSYSYLFDGRDAASHYQGKPASASGFTVSADRLGSFRTQLHNNPSRDRRHTVIHGGTSASSTSPEWLASTTLPAS